MPPRRPADAENPPLTDGFGRSIFPEILSARNTGSLAIWFRHHCFVERGARELPLSPHSGNHRQLTTPHGRMQAVCNVGAKSAAAKRADTHRLIFSAGIHILNYANMGSGVSAHGHGSTRMRSRGISSRQQRHRPRRRQTVRCLQIDRPYRSDKMERLIWAIE